MMRSNFNYEGLNGQGTPRKEDYESIVEEIPLHYYSRKLCPLNLHIAFLFGRWGNLLACSTNRVGTRCRGAGFSGQSIHAERAVLKSVYDIKALRGAKLVVIRINRKGELCNSKPCAECTRHIEKFMREYGLAKVYYS